MGNLVERFENLAGDRRSHENATLVRLDQYIQTATVRDVLILLEEVSRSRARLQSVADYSYTHANGFKKLTLLRRQGFFLRLHLWHGGQLTAENIHGHRWPFASRLISGSLAETRFVVSNRGAQYDEYVYRTPHPQARGTFELLRPVQLEQVADLLHEESSTYVLPIRHRHQVHDRATSSEAVSLVVTGPSLVSASNVYGTSADPPKPDSTDHSMTVEEVRDVIDAASSLLR